MVDIVVNSDEQLLRMVNDGLQQLREVSNNGCSNTAE